MAALPKALALAVLALALVEGAVWRNPETARFVLRHQPFAASGDVLIVRAQIRLLDPERSPQLVLLGSSQVREGLDCETLVESASQQGCLNLGLGGGSPLDMLHISRSLESASRRTVVIALFPGILNKAPKSGFIDTSTVSALVGSDSLRHLTSDDWRLMGLGLLQVLSPTLARRDGLRDGYREMALNGWANFDRDRTARTRRTSDADRRPPRYFTDRVGVIDDDFSISRFSSAQERGLALLIEREVRLGNRVWVVDFPTRPGFETTLAPAVKHQYTEQLARLRARAEIDVVEAESLGPLSEDNFLDFTHLDSAGRTLVSERLGRLLKGPRP